MNNSPAFSKGTRTGRTPLQELFGFDVAEKIYDMLPFREQIIVDLKLSGWSQEDIGFLLGVTQGRISHLFKQIRYVLANSKLLRERLTVEQAQAVFKHLAPVDDLQPSEPVEQEPAPDITVVWAQHLKQAGFDEDEPTSPQPNLL